MKDDHMSTSRVTRNGKMKYRLTKIMVAKPEGRKI